MQNVSNNQNSSSDKSPPNILFYSKYCPHCKKFADILFKLPHINERFVKISVDAKNVRLPGFVETVPTIVVFDQGVKQILTDTKAFAWVNQFLEENTQVDLVPYDLGVMSSSLSDGFSFIDDASGKGMEHTFAWMDKPEQTRIGLIAESTNSSNENKVNESQIERFKMERDRSVPNIQRPSEKIDFTKMYEQESKGQIDQTVINQLQQFRGNQVKRGPPPQRAPNFQSQNFQSQNFQSQNFQSQNFRSNHLNPQQHRTI